LSFRLAGRCKQDQWRGIGGLGREREVQKDVRITIEVREQRHGVKDNPGHDDDRLADDVLRRPEETRRLLRPTAERVLTERAVLLLHGPRVGDQPDVLPTSAGRPNAPLPFLGEEVRPLQSSEI